jgi:hypothetical protein
MASPKNVANLPGSPFPAGQKEERTSLHVRLFAVCF